MDLNELQAGVEILQRDLLHHRADIGRARPDFESRIGRRLSVSEPFQVRRLASDAAFETDKLNRFVFNANAFAAFHKPIDDLERTGGIGAEAAAVARQMAVEQLVVHELAHVGIGLVHFEDVQPFKRMVGTDVLAEIDIVADGTAAHVCALLETLRADERGSLSLPHRFLDQLTLMGNFAFPAFHAPPNKPHKRRRFLGLTMMAARVKSHLNVGSLPDVGAGELPLYAPIYPYTNCEGEVLICAFNPDRVIWGRAAKVDKILLALTLDEIDAAPFAVSVARASKLLQQVGRLSLTSTEIVAVPSLAEGIASGR